MDHSSFEFSQRCGSVRNPSLAGAGRAFDGIDFAARLYRLHHDGVARSHAGFTGMLFDLRRHVDPFRPPKEN